MTDNQKLKTHITESLPNFAEFTVVEAATPQQQLSTIYIGHLDEFHYVPTKHLVPYICPLKPRGGGGTPLFGLYGDVPLDRVWFFGLAILNRVCNLTCLCPKQVRTCPQQDMVLLFFFLACHPGPERS